MPTRTKTSQRHSYAIYRIFPLCLNLSTRDDDSFNTNVTETNLHTLLYNDDGADTKQPTCILKTLIFSERKLPCY